MSVTIVVGGQYGSEGKGKVVHYIGSRMRSPWLVRCGGPNSGHHLTVNGQDTVLRQLPSCIHPTATYCVPAGAVVDVPRLVAEVKLLSLPKQRVVVDPRAVLLGDEDSAFEKENLDRIASTCVGNGAALARRMMRGPHVRLACDSEAIAQHCRVEPVALLLQKATAAREPVLIEGTQGFMLSLLHSPYYPHCTSRDTTASACAAEAGIPARSVNSVVMVLRTFPIRVGGPSGPLPNEMTWEEVAAFGKSPEVEPEYTSVTNRLRRVAAFDLQAMMMAFAYNAPSTIAVMGLDRLDYGCRVGQVTEKAHKFLHLIYGQTGIWPSIVGTGPTTEEIFTV